MRGGVRVGRTGRGTRCIINILLGVCLMAGVLNYFQTAAADPRMQQAIFGEGSGGTQEEIDAITSVFLNRVRTQGLQRALEGSAAFNTNSPQYTAAGADPLLPADQVSADRVLDALTRQSADPSTIEAFTHFENINKYPVPSFASSTYEDKGRQRFYTNAPDPVSDVAEIQRALVKKGFNPGKIDGYFGEKTRMAVKEFQEANGLTVDGIAGKNTKGLLFDGE